MITDGYLATAGAYDLFAENYVGLQKAALAQMVPLLNPAVGPVLDIGCGSGQHAAYLLDAVPEARVLGLEPSDSMRALAVGRLAAKPTWRVRVTVRPEGALSAPLPVHLCGVVMLGVFGHFSAEERGKLLKRLADRLPAGSPILLDLQLPEAPAHVASYVFADTSLGDLRYRGFAEGTPAEGEAMRWKMTYQTLDQDTVLDERSTEHIFYHPHHDVVQDEMRAHGFVLAQLAGTTFWIATRTTD